MNKHTPVRQLELLEFWLDNSWSCIKCLLFFNICFGVSLSPFLFAVYLDDLVDGRYNAITALLLCTLTMFLY